jgi:hypothetical protein
MSARSAGRGEVFHMEHYATPNWHVIQRGTPDPHPLVGATFRPGRTLRPKAPGVRRDCPPP